MYDGNYVIASAHRRPWRKQLNLLVGYLYFYNIVWLAAAIWRRKSKVSMKPAYMQMVGMLGLIPTIGRTFGWALRLMFGRIDRLDRPPAGRIPARGADGAPGSHGGCDAPEPSRRARVRLPVAT
jgi:hypothetical protein